MHVHACCIIKFKHHVYHTKTKSLYILWDKKIIIIIIIKYFNLSVCTSLSTWRRASMRIYTCIYSAHSFFWGLRVRLWKYQKYSVFETLTAGKLFFCFVRTFTDRRRDSRNTTAIELDASTYYHHYCYNNKNSNNIIVIHSVYIPNNPPTQFLQSPQVAPTHAWSYNYDIVNSIIICVILHYTNTKSRIIIRTGFRRIASYVIM